MSRNKYPQQTIDKILDVAFQLFMEKGYEQTTIQDIVHEIGMSKGAIYHHFKSKEDILEAISKRSYYERNHAIDVSALKNLNGLEKLRIMFKEELSNFEKIKLDKMIMPLLKNPKYLAMTMEAAVQESAPLIRSIIDEGIEDGSIPSTDSKSASEVIMMLVNVWMNPMIYSLDDQEILRKLLYFKELTEKMGIPILSDDLLKTAISYLNDIKF